MIRIRAVWTGVSGSPWYSNFYFAGSGSTDAQAAADAVYALFFGLRNALANDIVISIDPFAPTIDPATGDITGGFTVDPGDAIGGAATDDMLPTQTQALVTLRTGQYVGGREIRGKWFLGGLTEVNNVQTGLVSSSLISAVTDLWETLLATGPDLLVWSRKNGVTAPVQSATMTGVWSVLRSRRD
jgi:hypothetical protein